MSKWVMKNGNVVNVDYVRLRILDHFSRHYRKTHDVASRKAALLLYLETAVPCEIMAACRAAEAVLTGGDVKGPKARVVKSRNVTGVVERLATAMGWRVTRSTAEGEDGGRMYVLDDLTQDADSQMFVRAKIPMLAHLAFNAARRPDWEAIRREVNWQRPPTRETGRPDIPKKGLKGDWQEHAIERLAIINREAAESLLTVPGIPANVENRVERRLAADWPQSAAESGSS